MTIQEMAEALLKSGKHLLKFKSDVCYLIVGYHTGNIQYPIPHFWISGINIDGKEYELSLFEINTISLIAPLEAWDVVIKSNA